MEAVALVFLFIIYIVIRVLFSGKTVLERDAERFDIGMRHHSAREYYEGIQYFGEKVRQHPRSALAWTMLGTCYYHANDYLSALSCLEKAVQIDNLGQAYLYKGRISLHFEDYPQALIEFNKALWFDRSLAQAHRYRGHTLIGMGKNEEAVAAFRAGVALGDEHCNIFLQQRAAHTSRRLRGR
jgi:tetratricopeptide (TPR) repeat protein